MQQQFNLYYIKRNYFNYSEENFFNNIDAFLEKIVCDISLDFVYLPN